MEEIVTYKTKDGQVFDDEDEAVAHEFFVTIHGNIALYDEECQPIDNYDDICEAYYVHCIGTDQDELNQAMAALYTETGWNSIYEIGRLAMPGDMYVYMDDGDGFVKLDRYQKQVDKYLAVISRAENLMKNRGKKDE